MGEPRYRCDGCGNLTRFDVTTSQTTKAFHHYTVGGELEREDVTVLSRHVDEVVCRWCGHGRSVVEVEVEVEFGDADVLGEADGAGGGGAGGGVKREEPGAHSRVP
jgi:hypothetical protein